MSGKIREIVAAKAALLCSYVLIHTNLNTCNGLAQPSVGTCLKSSWSLSLDALFSPCLSTEGAEAGAGAGAGRPAENKQRELWRVKKPNYRNKTRQVQVIPTNHGSLEIPGKEPDYLFGCFNSLPCFVLLWAPLNLSSSSVVLFCRNPGNHFYIIVYINLMLHRKFIKSSQLLPSVPNPKKSLNVGFTCRKSHFLRFQ